MRNIHRRTLLKGAVATVIMPAFTRASTSEILLRAKPASVQLVDADHPQTQIWGYNGGVPGPQIRAVQGDQIALRLSNDLVQPTSVHWHGLRVKNSMDGVPGITQKAVLTGEEFLYQLNLRDAGTFWYHSHNRSAEQVARGLYGVMVIVEPDAPDVDRDIVVVLDDWRLDEVAQISEPFGNLHDHSHAGRLGNFIHAMFDSLPAQMATNERLRLRFVNTATDRIMPISLRGVSGWVVARDGMPLKKLEPLGILTLGPAERADVIIDVTAEHDGEVLLIFHDRNQGYVLNDFRVSGAAATVRRPKPTPLSPNPIETLVSVAGARTIPLRMQGGAMGDLQEGLYKGKMLSMRDLVDQGQIWTLNGEAGLPVEPLFETPLHATIVFEMRNDTAFAHAMHMHGTHFQEVLPNDTFGPHKDTVLIQPGEARDFAFVADNPGKWLIHCHMLSHQSAGMKTWFRVG